MALPRSPHRPNHSDQGSVMAAGLAEATKMVIKLALFSGGLPILKDKVEIEVISQEDVEFPTKWMDDTQLLDGFDVGEQSESGRSWSIADGAKAFNEALQRLCLPPNMNEAVVLEGLSKNALLGEKKRVKAELKRYDQSFMQKKRRGPTRAEKEPMRPLYTFYRKLKTQLNKIERGGGTTPRSGRGSSKRPPPTAEGNDSDGDDGPEDKAEAEKQAKLAALLREKGQLRTKLQKYQDQFVKDNNRRIRFQRDIVPIDREYKQYKKVKDAISKLTGQVDNEKGLF
mmetsp:Transcript_99681/g.228762  ORF Transcript_99681/g.228762 Transcript_99681/m.228762 type:complete len:284 (-) Transcript_99681:190-1041(-)|eukprot:CAMPEP_0204371870 /NCGR_PEP_ID=MMETSP0469-20131031/46830_1 /ASSEMBLY_ACC=CAM_ASM_000384 /TAXON_ID=2969 /ORGANISM="Oxyrrhis marina" /LENGTH=283 /DNA_ID=CAMNT_0051362053 /DNA_START=26 /DNA_END=877 /DNA_ORIENTATION=-